MTTTFTAPTSTPVANTPNAPTTWLVAVGALFAANGAVLGSQLLTDSRDYSAVATTPVHLAHYVVWWVCLVALSQLYPRLGGLRGRTGGTLPTALLAFAGVGAVLDASARFVSAFVTPYLAARQPALVDSPPDAILLVPLIATGVVAMVATSVLAVVGLRRRVFPVPAAVLLLLGAIAIPALGPVSNVLLGAALAWIGLAARRRG